MEMEVATDFTPWRSLFGGVLIGLSAVMAMGLFGRIAGIAGITRLGAPGLSEDWGWRLAFLGGLVAAPLAYAAAVGPVEQSVPSFLPGMALAGLLVGFGATWGSGCTSGHGVCGIARLSSRSFAAVATFMATAALTVFILRHGV
jgi:uncharacterized membrane protein YedE/YeeE